MSCSYELRWLEEDGGWSVSDTKANENIILLTQSLYHLSIAVHADMNLPLN